MKTLFTAVLAVLVMVSLVYAWDSGNRGKREYEDIWGNNYKRQENLYKDTDRDGVINKYDYNDRNPNIQRPDQSDNSLSPYGSGSRSKRKSLY